MKTISYGVTILVLTIAVVPSEAATCTFEPQTGNEGFWADHNNWSDSDCGAGNVPDASDIAVIPESTICKIAAGSAQEALKIHVQGGAQNGGTLRIMGTSAANRGTLDTPQIVVDEYGALEIEDAGRLNILTSGSYSTVDGTILFTRSGTCTCDTGDPEGLIYLENDATMKSTSGKIGKIMGGCHADFSPCLNRGVIDGEGGVTLTLDPAGGLIFESYIRFEVAINIEAVVQFYITEKPDQLMVFNGQVTGEGDFLVQFGTVAINACMFLHGGDGGFDMGSQGPSAGNPSIVFNAYTCSEGTFTADDGVLDVNADVVAVGKFILGPHCFYPEPETGCEQYDDLTISVASGASLSFPRTGGLCSESCP